MIKKNTNKCIAIFCFYDSEGIVDKVHIMV